MNFDQVVEKRRSIRSYAEPTSFTKDQITGLILSAQQAPSWKNSQTGRYYIALTPEKIQAVRSCLNAHNQEVCKNIGALIVTSFIKNISGFDKNGYPDNELGNGWGCYDLGLQNAFLILKATDCGMDSIIMGLRDAGKLRHLLEIPENEEIVSVIALGYRDQKEVKKPERTAIEKITRFF